jgi:Na+-transporting methylmalonyl-CoA/oxaloacetate decarboxylase gamma subunit
MKTAYLFFILQGIASASPGWIDNIQKGNGLLIALIGMTVVFSGLVLISLIIRVLVHYVEERPKTSPNAQSETGSQVRDLSDEEVLAIVTAINLCSIYIEGEKQRLTWKFDQLDQSSWGITGRAQTLAQRSSISRLKG